MSILGKLGVLLKQNNVEAYIVPNLDGHGSTYLAPCDRRLAFLSGFSGDGVGVVTEDLAHLWTQGPYNLQAKAQVKSKEWRLQEGAFSMQSAITRVGVKNTETLKLGFNPGLVPIALFETWNSNLPSNAILVPIQKDLIDCLWEAKPSKFIGEIYPISAEKCGKQSEAKLRLIRSEMSQIKAEYLLVSSLDEIAWALNLRGKDLEHDLVFFSYLLIGQNNFVWLFCQSDLITKEAHETLPNQVAIFPYFAAYEKIKELVTDQPDSTFWLPAETTSCLFATLFEEKSTVETSPSPIAALKVVKNEVELQGMREANLKDSVAHCEFLCWLDSHVKTKKLQNLSEITAMEKFEWCRNQQLGYICPSFPTISAVGAHSAIYHYGPTSDTNVEFSGQTVFLIDSGGHYEGEGTTDVTRVVSLTMSPDKKLKEFYTRVLKCHISLASLTFPEETDGFVLDKFARRPLWQIGKDYNHDSGHGVSHCLGVVEKGTGFPVQMSETCKAPLKEGMCLAIEPGYYEEGVFGVRIENVYEVVKAAFSGFLKFAPLTYVPLEANLIETTMLNPEELAWLASYHENCRLKLKSRIRDPQLLLWLEKKTEDFVRR